MTATPVGSARETPDLMRLFQPRTVAIIGASERPGSLGRKSWDYARRRPGKAVVYPVSPSTASFDGVPAYPSISHVPEGIDVAFVIAPAGKALSIVRECAENGVEFAIVASSGFAEIGSEGREREHELLAASRGRTRIVGPNCNGLWSGWDGLSIGFNPAHDLALVGSDVVVIAQTGALLGSFITRLKDFDAGLGAAISTGNEADLTTADYLDYFARDDRCRTLALLLDSLHDVERMAQTITRAQAAGKRVLCLRFGASAEGRSAAQLHSARMGGNRKAVDAWLSRLHVPQTNDMEALALACALPAYHGVSRSTLAMSTSGAGAALLADLAEEQGIDLPPLSEKASQRLAELMKFSSPHNPLDLTGQALDPAWLSEVMRHTASESQYASAVLLATGLQSGPDGAPPVVTSLIETLEVEPRPTIVVAPGDLDAAEVATLQANGIRVTRSGAAAFTALRMLAGASKSSGGRWLAQRDQVVSSALPADTPAAGSATEERLLLHGEAATALKALRLPFPREAIVPARDIDAALEAAKRVRYPVVVKILDDSIVHKLAGGGLFLDVDSEATLRRVLARVTARKDLAPSANLLVQEQCHVALELFLGTVRDPELGPYLIFGSGGSDVEAARDVSFVVPPLDGCDFDSMVYSVRDARVRRLVQGQFRAEVFRVAHALGDFALRHRSQVSAIDINPLVMTREGRAIVLDVRIALQPDITSTRRGSTPRTSTVVDNVER